MITRLAPTPSGYIHQGNIFNFLLNWLWARSNKGKVLLRIDDGDSARKRREYTEDIFRVLDWLELDWDIGPSGPDDFEKNWSQHLRLPLYKEIINVLERKELLFACACTRKTNAASHPFSCDCLQQGLSLSTPGAAIRIKINNDTSIVFRDIMAGDINIDLATTTGAFVVQKKDGFPSYQVCSLADDQHFAVTHICRGNDLIESTAMQLHINQYINPPFFHECRFWHHALLQTARQEKLSKSAGVQARSIIGTVKKEKILHEFAEWMALNVANVSSAADLIPAFTHLISARANQ